MIKENPSTGTYISDIGMGWFIPYLSSPPPQVEQIRVVAVALLAASTIFMTSMIVIRLMIVRWKHIKIVGMNPALSCLMKSFYKDSFDLRRI
jgi:uncharacterized membrane protein